MTSIDLAHDPGPPRRLGASPWLALAALALWALGAFGALLLERPPAPLPANAPASEGAAGRALEVLERIARAPEERVTVPRPLGSEANARCRARIMDELRRMGLDPEERKAFATLPGSGTAATVHNIVAVVPGDGGLVPEDSAILAVAHHDSVPASPGIGDDLAGVAAILEAVRALRAGPALRRDLILLFTDGEERGLLGAEAFAAEHPLRDRVGAVINVEGRGASGPSRMFETGASNGPSIASLAAAARRPSASSVSTEIYRRMPNDTDFSVWRRRGIGGLNFAFIGDYQAYHSPVDDIDRLSKRSLQHHVTNVMDAVRAYDGMRSLRPGDGGEGAHDAVFFDVAGRRLVQVPVLWARILSGLALVLALFFAAFLATRRRVRPARAALAVLLVPLAVVAVVLGAVGTRMLLDVLGASGARQPASPMPILLATVLGGLTAGTLCARLAGALTSGAEALVALLFGLGLASLALAFGLPAASHLVIVPLLALLVGAFGALTSRRVEAAAALAGGVAALAAGVLWGPLQVAMTDAVGVSSGLVLGLPLAVGFACVLPALCATAPSGAPSWIALGLAACGIAAGVLGVRSPGASIASPGAVNIVVELYEDDAGSVWLQGEGAHTNELLRRVPDLETYDAPRSDGPWPEVEWLGPAPELDGYEVARVTPCSGTDITRLSAPPGVLVLRDSGFRGHRLRYVDPPANGFDVLVPRDEFGGAVLQVVDVSFGLGLDSGPRAEALAEARLPDLLPRGRGDRVERGRVAARPATVEVDAPSDSAPDPEVRQK